MDRWGSKSELMNAIMPRHRHFSRLGHAHKFCVCGREMSFISFVSGREMSFVSYVTFASYVGEEK